MKGNVATYAEKFQAKIDRKRARAAKNREAAAAAYAGVRAIGDMIPVGQPILVGHHSERRHRRDLDRVRKGLDKAVALTREADALERSAALAESGHVVYSDDPEAIVKLRAKLAKIEAKRERARKINRACRSKDPRKVLVEIGCTAAEIDLLLTPDFAGRIGVADYELANMGAEARRLAKRIAELRAKLKRAGFRWAPSVGAWQRHASDAAWAKAREIAAEASR